MKTTSKKNHLFSIPLKFRGKPSWDWLSSLRFLYIIIWCICLKNKCYPFNPLVNNLFFALFLEKLFVVQRFHFATNTVKTPFQFSTILGMRYVHNTEFFLKD